MDPSGGSLHGSHSRSSFRSIGIPTGSLTERNREKGFITMNHVVTHDQRDLQAAVIHDDLLYPACRLHAVDVEHGSHQTLFELLVLLEFASANRCRSGHLPETGNLVHLTRLLFQGHLPNQILNLLPKRADGRNRIFRRERHHEFRWGQHTNLPKIQSQNQP